MHSSGWSVDDNSQVTPFGKINSTVGTPRLIQLSLRYAF